MDIAWTLSSGGFRSGKKFPKGSSGSAVADLLKLPEINLGSRTFDSNLVIHTDLRSSEYADTWRAGYALGRLLRLAVGDATLANIHVLELGAGCGFTGLVAAQLGAQVVLTDKTPLTRVLSRNVAANHDSLALQPEVCDLDWASSSQREAFAARYPHFDVILCGDCMYEEDCIEPMVATLRCLSSPRRCGESGAQSAHDPSSKRTDVLFSLETRGPQSSDIHDAFFRRVASWFEVQEITGDCPLSDALVRGDIRIFLLRCRSPR